MQCHTDNEVYRTSIIFLCFVHGTVPVAVKVDTKTLSTQTCQQVTPSFQSPEQLTVMDVGAEADIYALGGVAVEVLAVSVFPWKC